jgi:hypothetical protein
MKSKIDSLKKANLVGGLEVFGKNLRPIIVLPPNVKDRPRLDFVREGNKITEWSL